MDKLVVVWEQRKNLIIVFTPLIFPPLPILVHKREAYCAYCILLMAVYWFTEVIPMAVTSFIPIVLFPLMGILSADDTGVVYLNDLCWLFVGTLTIAVTIEDSGLHKRIALRVLLFFGTSPQCLILGFMVSTSILSMWVSNTATTAMMIPIVEAVLGQLGENVQLQEDESVTWDEEGEENEEFELCANHGIKSPNSRRQILKQKKLDRVKKGMTICVPYAATIGGMTTLTGTGTNLVLAGQYEILFPNGGQPLTFTSWISYSAPTTVIMLLFGYVWLIWIFVGFNKNMLKIGCCGKVNEKDERVRSVLKKEYEKLGRTSWREGTALVILLVTAMLWLFRKSSGKRPGWDKLLPNSSVSDATVAITMAILLNILPSERPMILGGKNGSNKPMITWDLVQKKFPWGVLFLLGGGFSLAKGAEASGLSKWIGNQLALMEGIPPWTICLVTTLIACLFTECTSNAATAAILLPTLARMAQVVRIHPLYIMIPATTATSLAFMLPIATPPNAIAFAYGHLKLIDMAKAGWMLNVIGVILINFFINTYGINFFDLHHFPEWALPLNYTLS